MKAPECTSCFTGLHTLVRPQGSSCLPRRHGLFGQDDGQRPQGKLVHSKSSQWDVLSTVSTAVSESESADPTLAEASQEDLNAAAALQAIVEADDTLLALIRRQQGSESLAAFCMRFTRARPNAQAQALELLIADVKYREENQTHLLAQMTLGEVLGVGQSPDAQAIQEAVCQQVPHGILGFDKQGRAISYRSYTNLRIWELESRGISAKEMTRHHQWITEKCLRAMGHKGRWVQIVNIGGAGISQATSRAHLSYARMLAELDAAHYPERLSTIFIINAPRFFSGTWKLVSSWLDERTQARVQLLGGPEAWQGPLSECMDLRLLPRELGGETDLSFEKQVAPAPPLLPSAHSRSISGLGVAGMDEDEEDEEEEEVGGEKLLARLAGKNPQATACAAVGGGRGTTCAATSRSYCSFASVLLAAAVVFAASSVSMISTDSFLVA